ncbi:hyaluronan-binding protein 2-like [Nerophis ophidion]|uniref:hyaluronan-binding protein 2-like n=2 Tax=Nerophis ophidion TaxID=159077 RepID=UPI002AE05139|nr:hyaluronan-binding protein 2-like isoform X1 [Nerophis ophidion]XP_061766695.1 hyaluronan-binding protein 2-like [Nerophis ophidion]
MNLKLIFFCLFLVVILIPAETKPKKHKKHQHHHPHHHHHHHGHDHEHNEMRAVKHGKLDKRKERFQDIIADRFFGFLEEFGDDDDEDDEVSEWLFDLQEPAGKCNPNPCENNGVCEEKGKKGFKCDCPGPYRGRRCEKGRKVCKRGRCGRGDCVLTSTPPFYECKCKQPFQPPNCRTYNLCEPNPCKNGGACIKDGNDFDCECPPGFTGKFCHVGPNDCYTDDGESYRGNVSETVGGAECLYWNSHFILEKGTDPFNNFEDSDGLGPHNFCRNPDGDLMPWCFFRRGNKLLWNYCDVNECSDDISPSASPATPAPSAPPATPAPSAPPQPTQNPQPPTADPNQKPTQAPQASVVVPTATLSPRQFSSCGKPQPKKVSTRIFGGLKVPPGATPWQVSLQIRPEGSAQSHKHICGGVLIESCWVLTAGHCIEPRNDIQVVMGGLSLDADEPTEQIINVEEAIVHENYRETSTSVHNDIALLRLEGTDGVCANETQFVKTACLPDGPLDDGMECTISGWGATEESDYGSNHLLQANVLLINQDKCSESKIYGNVLDNGMFCAGHLQGGVDSCQGDSGGPLTCEQNNVHVVYGLVSWGDQCGKKNKPGVYARVTNFLDWIKSKTQAKP